MWVFTRYGFYSIACASRKDGSLDHQSLMIRARCKAHLGSLQKRFPALVGGKILELENRDYRYRYRWSVGSGNHRDPSARSLNLKEV